MTHYKGLNRATIALATLLATPSLAGEVDVLDAKITPQNDGLYRISVTLEHADEGWDHYANAWDVIAPDGTVLATRILAHPHVNEQPFTRSLGNIKIPESIESVTIRGRDSVHDYGGKTLQLDVTRP